MLYKYRLLLLSFLAAAFAGCRQPAVFEPGEILYEPEHAGGFAIYEAGEQSRAIRITDPWQGADGVEQWVFISKDGEEPPADFSGTVLPGPARRIVCMSSSYVAFLAHLDVSDRIVGVSGAGFITDPLISERWAAGDVADVGYETNLNFELIASLRPDLMLIYGVTDDGGQATGKYREMGVPYVFIGDYLEESPLGKAEWIVPIAEMCGLYAKGVQDFEAIRDSYDELKQQAAGFAGTPEVMFNAPYRDTWYVPGDRSYMVRLVCDAGGEYVCRGVDSRDSRPINIEEAYACMQKTDYWLNTNHYLTLADLLADNPRFAGTPPVREGHVFNNNARTTPTGGSDFWESGVVRPDVVLHDLMRMLHPEEFPQDTTYYYYKKLE